MPAELKATGSYIYLRCSYHDRELARSINGAKFVKKWSAWQYPLRHDTYQAIVATFPDVELLNDVLNKVTSITQEYKKFIDLKEVSFKNPDEKFRKYLALPLYNHQLKSFTYFKQMKCAVDFSEAGAMKTAVQIALIKYRAREFGVRKVLIICPHQAMKRVWYDDISKFAPAFSPSLFMMDKSVKQAEDYLKSGCNGIYIINYEKTWRVIKQLLAMNFDFVIADESSKVKKHSSKQSKAVHKFSDVRFRSILTATPSPNNEQELFSQYKFLDPRMFGDNFWSFRDRFFTKNMGNEFQWFLKPNSKDILKRYTEIYSASWEKRKCIDLPPLTSQVLECELTKEQRKAYTDMAKDMIAMINEETYDASIIITKLLRLNQISSGFIQNSAPEEPEDIYEFAPNPKLNLLIDTVKSIPKDKKIIIWAVFHHDIQTIHKALDYNYGRAVTYYGKSSKKDRTEALNGFIEGDTRFIIAHPKSLGMAVNLSVASYSIRYSMNYSYEDYAQSIERFNRHGQTEPMTEYNLIASGTNDDIVHEVVTKHKKGINEFITRFKNNYD